MNRKWLEEQGAEFHKRAYRDLIAQLVFSQHNKTGHERLIEMKLEKLKAFGKITKEEAASIETDVRVEVSEVLVALEEPLTLEVEKPALNAPQ